MLETIKSTTYVDSKLCTRNGRNLYDNLKNIYTEKTKSQSVKLRKLRNGKRPASKIISAITAYTYLFYERYECCCIQRAVTARKNFHDNFIYA